MTAMPCRFYDMVFDGGGGRFAVRAEVMRAWKGEKGDYAPSFLFCFVIIYL